jgi:hypothetical protein
MVAAGCSTLSCAARSTMASRQLSVVSSSLLMASPSWLAGSLYRVERLGGVAWSTVPATTSNRFVCCAQSWRFLALVCLHVHCTLCDGRVLLFDHAGSWLTTERCCTSRAVVAWTTQSCVVLQRWPRTCSCPARAAASVPGTRYPSMTSEMFCICKFCESGLSSQRCPSS